MYVLDVFVCGCVSVGTHVVHTWRSEGNLVELVLTFHLYIGAGNQVQVARLVWQFPLPMEPS